jgi:Tectonin domain
MKRSNRLVAASFAFVAGWAGNVSAENSQAWPDVSATAAYCQTGTGGDNSRSFEAAQCGIGDHANIAARDYEDDLDETVVAGLSNPPQIVQAGEPIKTISWEQLPGRAKDISVGADGSVWVIGTNPVGTARDFGIYEWDGSNWAGVDGGAVRIAVGPNGVPWVVNSAGQIFRRKGGAWKQLPGKAKDIGVGADGSVWVIGTNPVGTARDFGIYEWDGSNWAGVDGGAVRIAVGPNGVPWVVNSAGQIFRRKDGAWKQLPGKAKDIGVGADGSAWVIGTNPVGTARDFGIYEWDGSNWDEAEGGGIGIAVGPDATPWIVNSEGTIFKFEGV